MPVITLNLHTPIQPTFRVLQVAGLFDVPLMERLSHTLTAEVPDLDEDWTIGAIVGSSGSGKTTLARAAYGDAFYEPPPWPEGRAIIDCLGDAPLKDLARVLTAVGLGSVPTWLKPYHVLSTGERFRADVAWAVLVVQSSKFKVQGCNSDPTLNLEPRTLNSSRLLVLDEFTSALDRTVACTASAAIAKLLRSSTPQSAIPTPQFPRLVVLTCHRDILPWLQPDWVLDLAGDETTGGPRLTRGRLRRPNLRLAVRRVKQALWPRFARHHYLSGGLATAATCYAAFWHAQPVAFCRRCRRPRLEGSQADHAVGHAARISGPGHRSATGGNSRRLRVLARQPRHDHCQPPRDRRPLLALAALAVHRPEENR